MLDVCSEKMLIRIHKDAKYKVTSENLLNATNMSTNQIRKHFSKDGLEKLYAVKRFKKPFTHVQRKK